MSIKREAVVSAAEAAGKLETTQLKVLMLLKHGELGGYEEDGEWFVSRESLDAFKTLGERETHSPGGCAGDCPGRPVCGGGKES